MTRRAALALFGALAPAACFADLYLATGPDPDTSIEVPGGTLELVLVRVLVAELAVEGEGPAGSLSQSAPGPFDVDVLARRSTPTYPIFYLEAGTWESVSFSVELEDSVPGRAALELEGVFYPADGATIQQVRVLFNSAELFSLTREGPFELVEPRALDILEVFEPRAWFTSVDLRTASANEGSITISETHNTVLFEQLSEGIDQALSSFLNA